PRPVRAQLRPPRAEPALGPDITEHPTREGKLYCAVVLDAYSRRVVGWSVDATPTAALVTNAPRLSIQTRTRPRGTITPSDQGCSLLLGRSPAGPRTRGWCRRWAMSVTATTLSRGSCP